MSLALRNLIVFALCGFSCTAAFSQGEADIDRPPSNTPLGI
ncbi:hypothetical protein SAMN04489798_3024 [Pseudomonas arsenicoxydans]|uniref:Uncharacterized protein n=1 Tax=Pseudomonas arsenicoxydans TaxID=702115 RepID=A0A1H0JT27_9PSED|nr:hypothetical protein SAMN04489798_3024 [Pseudomonas arsenicoxydans]